MNARKTETIREKKRSTRSLPKRIPHIALLAILAAALCLVFAEPQQAACAQEDEWVFIGNTEITEYNDWKWHSCSEFSDAGWTAGSFRLSADRSRLELASLELSDTSGTGKIGLISASIPDLTIAFSGTNRIGTTGIYDSIYNSGDLTLAGDSSASTVQLDGKISCYEWNGGKERELTLESGTIVCCGTYASATKIAGADVTVRDGKLMSEFRDDLIVSGGSLTLKDYPISMGTVLTQTGGSVYLENILKGKSETSRNLFQEMNISGGTFRSETETGTLVVGGYQQTGGEVSIGYKAAGEARTEESAFAIIGYADISGGKLEVGGADSETGGALYCSLNLTITGGEVTAIAGDGTGLTVGGGFVVRGGTIHARNRLVGDTDGYGLQCTGLSMSGGKLILESRTAGMTINTSGKIFTSPGILPTTPEGGQNTGKKILDAAGEEVRQAVLQEILEAAPSRQDPPKIVEGTTVSEVVEKLFVECHFYDGSVGDIPLEALSYTLKSPSGYSSEVVPETAGIDVEISLANHKGRVLLPIDVVYPPPAFAAGETTCETITLEGDFDGPEIEIWRAESPEGPFQLVAGAVFGVSSWTDTKCRADTTYYYKARRNTLIFDSAAGSWIFSDFSDVVSATTDPMPPAPEPESAPVDREIKKPAGIRTYGSIAKGTMRIEFSPVKGAVNYSIAYRLAGKKTWTYRWTDRKTEFTVKNLKKGQLLEFKFAAFMNKNGTLYRGDYSKTSYRYFKNTPKGKVKAGKGVVTVKVKKVKGASGYVILYATNKNMKGQKAVYFKGKEKTSLKLKGLKKGKTYYISYRPYKEKKGKKYIGVRRKPVKIRMK
ncbi:MAG: hypothetical protein IJ109_02195 [Firmicutes bacterium]|nr:hypothetical protein [Bacillota bacterium]